MTTVRASDHIVYEQPLNERVRSFLRLEHLFNIIGYRIHGDSEWDSRGALAHLIEVVDLLSRSDIKGELIKELERNNNVLSSLSGNPGVDPDRLNMIMSDISTLLERLRDPTCQPGQALRINELVTSIRQRSAIPGGTCKFDLPAYHHWLTKALEYRAADLDRWYKDISIIQEGVDFALSILRNSALPKKKLATTGFFQQPLEANSDCQLIRVLVSRDDDCFPEISGGRHRFTIRFLEQQDTLSRPAQVQRDIQFELHCCML
jgi:cell division protein ZapD